MKHTLFALIGFACCSGAPLAVSASDLPPADAAVIEAAAAADAPRVEKATASARPCRINRRKRHCSTCWKRGGK